MQNKNDDIINKVTQSDYEFGFVTDIENDAIKKG